MVASLEPQNIKLEDQLFKVSSSHSSMMISVQFMNLSIETLTISFLILNSSLSLTHFLSTSHHTQPPPFIRSFSFSLFASYLHFIYSLYLFQLSSISSSSSSSSSYLLKQIFFSQILNNFDFMSNFEGGIISNDHHHATSLSISPKIISSASSPCQSTINIASVSAAYPPLISSSNDYDNNDNDNDNELYQQPSFKKNRTHDLTFLLPINNNKQPTSSSTESPLSATTNFIVDGASINIVGNLHDSDSREDDNDEEYQKIYAHKSIVSLKSEFFRLLLTNGMKESSQQEIIIPNVPVHIFFDILQFLYTSNLVIHDDSLNRIFEVCDQFLLQDGKEKCKEYIKQLDSQVLESFLFDENYFTLCGELNNLYFDQTISNSSYFLQLNRVARLPKELLLKILSSEDVLMQEVDIFKAVVEWIKINIDDAHKKDQSLLNEMFGLVRFPLMEYEELITIVEPFNLVPQHLLLEAYRHLSKPKMFPLEECQVSNTRLVSRKKLDPPASPGTDVHSFICADHSKACSSVTWTISNFSSIKTQKHVSNIFEMRGLKWRMWAYPAGEAKHSDSFSVYLEAVRVKEKESYDFLRNTTFFFALVNQKNKTNSKQYPSSPNVLFNYEKSVWGNGLIELKNLYDSSSGFLDNDTVCVQLHILECIALEG
ncbi:BTB/POZ domain-containing protein [Cavenderia fasciculata]|uniref:BTB/POZ domain-containing protein n=1 Tax=Cavenderia fasciculata TaxID=261658 RepID=F4QDT9_CACFS|nr:BTB/POZ domain-containing protein [Cavenderia fasciculata]EGG13886.1 BTB/POZ domain-containing protein [Cavenderia fasciculata]|eukprot:XP_004350594.1 BTB/POZ domain-containing protein [Cavenderia fasciculata]